MRKLVLCLSVFLLSVVSAPAAVIFSEGFDNVSGLVGGGWEIRNFSTPGGTTTWFQGNTGIFNSHSGTIDSYVAANYLAAPTGGVIDLYLFAPAMLLMNGDTINFWTRTETGSLFGDRLQVGLDSLSVLLDINPGNTAGGYPDGWTQYNATVSGLGAPTVIKFGFLYSGPADSMNYIGIDSVSVERSDIPEPSTFVLVGSLLALGFARSRRVR